MALVSHPPFQPEVNTAPTSPASSASTTDLAPRPVVLAASGVWEPSPALTEKDAYLELEPASEPVPSNALAIIPRSTPSPTPSPTPSATPSTKLLPAPATPAIKSSSVAPTTPKSILKPSDVPPPNRLSGYSPTTTTSSSSSVSSPSKSKKGKAGKRSRGKSIKEGAFYAFVLLPLSCWYTRGGKRLKAATPLAGSGAKGAAEGRKGEMVEWGGDEEDEDEEDEIRVRVSSQQDVRRSMHGRRESWSQGGSGGVKGNVAGRRQSFSASVPAGMVVGAGGRGRSNSFTTVRGRPGSGFGAPRREILDYGVDSGPPVADRGELEWESEFDRLRLSRQKSRTGSPVPLRRRMSDV